MNRLPIKAVTVGTVYHSLQNCGEVWLKIKKNIYIFLLIIKMLRAVKTHKNSTSIICLNARKKFLFENR